MELTASVVVIHLLPIKTWARTRTAHSAAAHSRFCVSHFINRPLQTEASPTLNKGQNASGISVDKPVLFSVTSR
jgi:hypothetical protein